METASTVFTLNEVLLLLGMVATGIGAHFSAKMTSDSRINRLTERFENEQRKLQDELHALELKSATTQDLKNEFRDFEHRLEENFTKTVKLEIARNNEALAKSLISQMSHMMEDKLKGYSNAGSS